MTVKFAIKFQLLLVLLITVSSCATDPIRQLPSKGQNARIQNLVLHFTAQNYKQSLYLLKESGMVSAHYLIPRLDDDSYQQDDLQILQLVDESQRAWHAGVSYWQNRHNLNDTSIGIEVVNVPKCDKKSLQRTLNLGGEYGPERNCQFDEFEPQQLELLISLAQDILARHPDIHPTRVIGHADIAPGRKSDPGPKFPWKLLAENGVGAWYDDETYLSYVDMFNEFQPPLGLLQKALLIYGYKVEVTGVWDQQTRDALYAFQLHFTPEQMSDSFDTNSSAVLFALIEKHLFPALPSLLKAYFNQADKERNQQQPSLILQQVAMVGSTSHYAFIGRKGRETLYLEHDNLQNLDLSLSLNGKAITDKWLLSSGPSHYLFNLEQASKTGKNLLSIRQRNTPQYLEPAIGSIKPKLLTRRTNRKLNKLVADSGFSGSVTVQQYGETLHHQNTAQGLPIKDKQGYTNLALYLALLKLTEQGLLDIDKPVTDYLAEYKGVGREYRRVIDLLQHRSGYPESSENRPTFANKTEYANWLLTQLDFAFPAGQSGNLSSYNEQILILLVERLSGQTFQAFLQQHYFADLQVSANWHYADHITELSLKEQDVLTLAQLIQDQGVIEQQRYFKPTKLWQLMDNENFLTALLDDAKGQSIQSCLPISSANSWLFSTQSGYLLFIDREYDLHVLIAPAGGFSYKKSSFHCGFTAFQTDLLNNIYLEFVH